MKTKNVTFLMWSVFKKIREKLLIVCSGTAVVDELCQQQNCTLFSVVFPSLISSDNSIFVSE